MPDLPGLPDLVAAFGARLRAAGLPVGPDRGERFARAVTVLDPRTTRDLYHCALATLVSDPEQLATFGAVFAEVFQGVADPAGQRGQDPGVERAGTGPRAGSPAAAGTAP